MAAFSWKVEALVIDAIPHGGVPTDTVVVLVDDEEWLRCHYDPEREEWVESSTAHISGMMRHAKPSPKELLEWLLGSSAQRGLTDKIASKVQQYFDNQKLREAADEARSQADELRQLAEE
jgi:hypothetical protein